MELPVHHAQRHMLHSRFPVVPDLVHKDISQLAFQENTAGIWLKSYETIYTSEEEGKSEPSNRDIQIAARSFED